MTCKSTYSCSEAIQTDPIRHIEAQDHHARLQQRPIFRRRRVVEFEAVRMIVHAYIVDEWLVEVAEEGDRPRLESITTELEAPGDC
jgi:hypothetical protein